MLIVVGIVFYMKPCVIEDTLTQYIVINQILYLLTCKLSYIQITLYQMNN